MINKIDWSPENPVLDFSFSFFDSELYEEGYRYLIEDKLENDFQWEEALEVMFVIDELITNAIEHGCKGIGNRQVEVELRMSPDLNDIKITVIDEGSGFDLDDTMELVENLPDNRKRQRGLMYIQRLTGQKLAVGESDGRNKVVARFYRNLSKHEIQKIKPDIVKVTPQQTKMDTRVAFEFDRELHDIIQRGFSKIIIDLVNVDYISSSGVGAIVTAYNKTKNNGGRLILIHVTAKMRKIFDMIGFGDNFGFYLTEEEAMKKLQESDLSA